MGQTGTIWKWSIIGGLIGYLIIHPAVMIAAHAMLETASPRITIEMVIHEIWRSFAIPMLPWSMAFTVCTALIGAAYGRVKATEKRLAQSRRRYQGVIDNQLDYICRFTPEGNLTFVNDAFCRLFGRSRSDLLGGAAVADLPHFIDRPTLGALSDALASDKPAFEREGRLRSQSGAGRWIRWVTIAIEDDRHGGPEYQCVGQDITERKQAQDDLVAHQRHLENVVRDRTRALTEANTKLLLDIEERKRLEAEVREQETHYRTLFESMPTGITLTTIGGQLKSANASVQDMLGYTLEELQKTDVKLLYCEPEDRRRVLERFAVEGRIRDLELKLRRKDGSPIDVSVNLTPFNLGGTDLILTVIQDITRRTEALAALKASASELQKLSDRLLSIQEEERKRIAQGLHDSVGQLLHACKYSLETALKQLHAAPEAGVDDAAASVQNVIRLVGEASEETRRIVMDLRPSLLDDIGFLATANWFCREYQKIYSDITISKRFDVEEKDIPVLLRTAMYRILQEAFNNIAKHSRADQVDLTIEKTWTHLVMAVSDNGLGVNPEDGTGTPGFGIPGMRQRAHASGGTLTLEAAPGGGTRLTVKWPIRSGAA